MKKSIFIIAALLTTTFANAQITLERSLPVEDATAYIPPYLPCSFINYIQKVNKTYSELYVPSELPCPFYFKITANENDRIQNITFINPNDFSIYKTLDLSGYNLWRGFYESIFAISYNVFAVDKIALIIKEESTYDFLIIDEDGVVLQRLHNYVSNGQKMGVLVIEKMNDQWKLIVPTKDNNGDRATVDIYSFPGDGSVPQAAQAVSTPSSPKRSARKIAREGQVLVQTDNNTYTLTGAEVK